jgi:hypothetical protein
MSQGNTIGITVYVTGAPFAVSINTHQKVEELVRKALHEAGKRCRPVRLGPSVRRRWRAD